VAGNFDMWRLTSKSCRSKVEGVSKISARSVEDLRNCVVISSSDRATVFKLSGELDLAVATIVRAELANVDGDVELDCAGLTFIDASGVSLLVEIHTLCTDRGAKLTIVNAPHCVTWMLSLTRLDGVLRVRTDSTAS
jgi:anti-anti-sigma factor